MADATTADPLVGLIMGSAGDWPVMRVAAEHLERFSVAYEKRIVSAHRTPEQMFDYARTAAERGLRCIIAGAGGAAHLPGMVAALTTLPVLGVPVPGRHLSGYDSLLSIVQMPRGVPVATFAVGEAGAANAALFACALLAVRGAPDSTPLGEALRRYRDEQRQSVLQALLPD